jgi:hypothetical protein
VRCGSDSTQTTMVHLVGNLGLQVTFYGGQNGDATARPAPVRHIMRAGPNAVVVLIA